MSQITLMQLCIYSSERTCYMFDREKSVFLSNFIKDDKPRQKCKDSATLYTQIKQAKFSDHPMGLIDYVTKWPKKWLESHFAMKIDQCTLFQFI